jgi:hypothetical protein
MRSVAATVPVHEPVVVICKPTRFQKIGEHESEMPAPLHETEPLPRPVRNVSLPSPLKERAHDPTPVPTTPVAVPSQIHEFGTGLVPVGPGMPGLNVPAPVIASAPMGTSARAGPAQDKVAAATTDRALNQRKVRTPGTTNRRGGRVDRIVTAGSAWGLAGTR